MNELAYPHAIRDIIAEYKYKSETMVDEITTFEAARYRINDCTAVKGGFVFGEFVRDPYLRDSEAQRRLLASAWKALYVTLNLDRVFSSTDKNRFEQSLESPPALTLENLTATFGDYWENPRHYILKGLAEAFCKLDKFYKSHTNFGVGAKGLPKRVILNRFSGSFHSYGAELLVDICSAMLQVMGSGALTKEERDLISQSSYKGRDFELERLGLTIKTFLNGNAHVHFSPNALNVVNDALHEFYGEVLPDDAGDKPKKKQKSTEVSKDLQFYRTPKAVIDRLLGHVHIAPNSKILEPSCGDGAILDALVKKGHSVYGVEYDAGRAKQSKEKGHPVLCANFLELEPRAEFDYVIMNPPFSGKHYVKHVEHAQKFLREGGSLITILPASAWYEHKILKGIWYDLPMCSFKESGTNVNTGFLIVK